MGKGELLDNLCGVRDRLFRPVKYEVNEFSGCLWGNDYTRRGAATGSPCAFIGHGESGLSAQFQVKKEGTLPVVR
jgi:hypothetical protein